jgi:hypothetical protein
MVINVDEAANKVATNSKESLDNDENNKLAKTEGSTDAEASNTNNDSELILIQDNAFTIKIQVPNLEPFELQVGRIAIIIK